MEPTAADLRSERARKSKAILKKMYNLESNPYFAVNANGRYECSLCHTVHTTIQSFVLHRDGKKHNESLKQRQRKLNLRPSDIRLRSLLKEGLRGFGLEIRVEKARKWPVYKFIESSGEGIVYVEVDPYRTVGFRYRGSIVCNHLSEHFDPREKKYFLHFFMGDKDEL